MTNKIQTVHLSPLEWKQYKQLRLNALKTDPQAFGKSYDEAIKDPDEKWISKLEKDGHGNSWSIFARADNKLVGMIEAAIHSDEPDKVWIHAVFVDPEYRGKGIAQKLISQILDEIDKSNAPKIVKLGVNKHQTAALKLYERSGFYKTGKQHFVMGNGEKTEEILMEKKL